MPTPPHQPPPYPPLPRRAQTLAAEAQGVHLRVDARETTLENGMQVITVVDNSFPTASLCLFYRVGSRNEVAGRTGMSHLFEHLMFNGSERYPGSAFDLLLERAGGTSNAFTTEDLTCYQSDFPAEHLELVLRLEADRMARLVLDAKTLSTERSVVKEERLQTVDDEPVGLLLEELQAAAYRTHPYRWPVIGWMEDLDRISLKDCHDFYTAHYRPENALLVVAGDLDHKDALARIHKHFGSLRKAGAPLPPPPPTEERPLVGTTRVHTARHAQAPLLAIGWLAWPVQHPDAALADVLAEVLAGGEAARLERRLVRREGVALAAHAGAPWRLGPALFTLLVEGSPDHDVARIERLVEEELEALRQVGPDSAEVERAVTRIRAAAYRQSATNGGIAETLGNSLLYLGALDGMDRYLERLGDIRVEELRAAAQKILRRDRRVVATTPPLRALGPALCIASTPPAEPTPENNRPARPTHVDPAHLPRTPAPHSAPRFHRPALHAGPGGLGLALLADERLPLVSMRYLCAAGSSADPVDRAGLARLSADLLQLGTKRADAEAIAEAVDAMGGVLNVAVGREAVSLQFELLADRLPEALALLADLLLRPTFATEHLRREKELLQAEARTIADRPDEMADVLLWSQVFGEHPYAHRPAGSVEGIGGISGAEVAAFHRRHYRPEHSVLCLVGCFDPERAAGEIATAFRAWGAPQLAAAESRALPLPQPGLRHGRCVAYQAQEGLSQCQVSIGTRGPQLGAPGKAALELANAILGGAFTSRLNERLRVDLGLTYGVFSAPLYLSKAGLLTISFSTSAATTAPAIEAAIDVVAEFTAQGPGPEEVESARAQTRGQIIERLQAHPATAAEAAYGLFHGLGADHGERHFRALEAVQHAAVVQACRHLALDDLKIAVIGPPGLEQALRESAARRLAAGFVLVP